MSWTKYVYFLPAAIFFTVLLTIFLRNLRKKRRHRRRPNQITPVSQPIAKLTMLSDPPAPKLSSEDKYVEDLKVILAELRRGTDRRLGSEKRNGS